MAEDKIETFMIYEERLDHYRDIGTYRHPILIIRDTYEKVEQFVKDLDFVIPKPKWPADVKRSFSTIALFEGVADFHAKRNERIKECEAGARMIKATEAIYQGY